MGGRLDEVFSMVSYRSRRAEDEKTRGNVQRAFGKFRY